MGYLDSFWNRGTREHGSGQYSNDNGNVALVLQSLLTVTKKDFYIALMHCFSGRCYIAPKPFIGENIREIRILLPFSENYWPANLYGLTKLPLHVFNQSLGQIWALQKIGALSIRQKFQLPFPELFKWRLEQHCSELEWKRTFLRRNFCITWLFSRNFRLNGSLFVNFTIYGFSRNFSRKFPFHLSLFRNFRIFLLNRIFFHGAKRRPKHGTGLYGEVLLRPYVPDGTKRMSEWASENFSRSKVMTSEPKTSKGHFRVLLSFCFKTSSACSFIFMQIKVIFIRMVSHLDTLWNRVTRELRNGLLSRRLIFTCIN